MADGGVSAQPFAADFLSGPGGIAGLHHLHLRMLVQETATLHQGHGMGIDFGDSVPVILGQTHDAVLNVQFVVPHDGHAALAQQFVVVEQAAGNGVFNRHEPQPGIVVAHLSEYLLERIAANQFHLILGKVLMGGNIVERAPDALNRYLLHYV